MQKTLMKIITTVFFIFFLFSIVFLNKTSTDDLKNKVFAASPEYLPVPSDIVPMSGILTNIAGNGPTYDSENNVLQITNRTRQVGGIWSKKKLDFSKNFVYSSYVYLGKEGSNAADGVTFTFQNDPRMETAPSSVIAGGGFALGAYGNYRNKRNGYIKNALSIEFDTYRNTGSSDAIDREVQSNDGKGHVAIIIPKPNNNTASGNHLNVQYPTDFLSNGKWRKFEISWDATDNTMTYGLEGLSNKTFKFDPLQTFGDTKAYWGFTGSTGTKSAVNAVAISQIPQKGNQLLNIVDLTTGQTLSNHGSVNAGDELEYQLDTTYIDGPEDWADVYIKINLPAGLSYVPNSIYSNGKKVSDAGSVHQQLINVGIGTLTTNQTNKLSFKAKVNDDIANKTVLVNRGLAFNENFGIGSNTIALEVVKSTAINLKKEVVNLNGVPNPKDSDYKDNVTGLPGDKFRYHIRINATNGTTDHIVFRDNDFDKDETEYWDDKADNYMLIHHNDGTSDEKVKLIGKDFADPNTIDFSKRFKSDQIGNGAYIDLYFTVGTLGILTPVGTVIPNTAHVVSTSGGDNDGHGWASNTANISLYPDPSMTKQVKLATDKASAYTDKLEASPDSDLDYRVQIKPNKDVKDPELNEIKLSDPFDNKLNQGLTLKKVTANYYDADNKIINDQTEVLTPDSQQVVALSHPVVPGGHVDIVYQVHLDQAAPARTTFKNIAYMESSSYGKNPDHQLPNWQTNNAQVTVANSDGTVNFKYVDLDTGKEIAGHNPVQVTGKVDHKVSEYTKDQLAPAYIDGYTVMKEQIDDQAIQRASKTDPVIAQKPQTYTYYYEKAALSMEAPKNWNFGRYNTSQTEATYYLPARQDAHGKTKPYTVDVHDAYGVKDWTLKVQQKHQFTGINPTNKKVTILSGAQLNFTHLNAEKTSDDGQDTHPQGDQLDLLSGDQFKLPVGNETPTALMSYHNAGTYVTAHDQNPTGTQYDNPGVKSFAYQFGDRTNAGYSIGLHVPASTKREATDYTTTLTWSLSVAP